MSTTTPRRLALEGEPTKENPWAELAQTKSPEEIVATLATVNEHLSFFDYAVRGGGTVPATEMLSPLPNSDLDKAEAVLRMGLGHEHPRVRFDVANCLLGSVACHVDTQTALNYYERAFADEDSEVRTIAVDSISTQEKDFPPETLIGITALAEQHQISLD